MDLFTNTFLAVYRFRLFLCKFKFLINWLIGFTAWKIQHIGTTKHFPLLYAMLLYSTWCFSTLLDASQPTLLNRRFSTDASLPTLLNLTLCYFVTWLNTIDSLTSINQQSPALLNVGLPSVTRAPKRLEEEHAYRVIPVGGEL